MVSFCRLLTIPTMPLNSEISADSLLGNEHDLCNHFTLHPPFVVLVATYSLFTVCVTIRLKFLFPLQLELPSPYYRVYYKTMLSVWHYLAVKTQQGYYIHLPLAVKGKNAWHCGGLLQLLCLPVIVSKVRFQLQQKSAS